MYETQYHRATSVEDAARQMGAAEDGKFLSGGMTLIPTMKQRLASPSHLIDLRHIPGLKGITITGKTVRIGAATTHYDVAVHAELARLCPAITHLAAHIGDPQVRNMGTIGGSVANNDPAADYPAALLALNATVITSARSLAAADFFAGLFETALEPDEIVTAVEFTAPDRAAYKKFPNPASLYAMAGVFVAKAGNEVRVAVTGAGENGVFRAQALEAALAKSFSAAALDGVVVSADGLMSDMHASADYRANLVKVMAKRAVAEIAG
ncbi:FAD binding domain-containing protein [Phyllobacterium sp. NPDC097923]|uniref:FAD binding domain-containing protein n=1 Tax=Phyllobacterium sp. NPDC097923 TaxID=3364404 RepID=UPI00383A6B6C